MVRAMSFTIFGIVPTGVVCRVDNLVMLPIIMDARVRRVRGKIMFLVSL